MSYCSQKEYVGSLALWNVEANKPNCDAPVEAPPSTLSVRIQLVQSVRLAACSSTLVSVQYCHSCRMTINYTQWHMPVDLYRESRRDMLSLNWRP